MWLLWKRWDSLWKSYSAYRAFRPRNYKGKHNSVWEDWKMHSWRSSLIQRGENGLNWKYDIRFLFHAYILFCGPLCYKEPWAMLSPSVQCVITFDMCLSWLKASLKQWAWARHLSRCIRMGPYRSILYQDTVLHTSCSLELVLLIQSLVIPHCAVSAVLIAEPVLLFMEIAISPILSSLVWHGSILCDLQVVRKTSSLEHFYLTSVSSTI